MIISQEKAYATFMSRKLKDSAFRLLGKAANDIENNRLKKALENLDKAEKISDKVKDPEISYHLLVFRGLVKYKNDEPEEALKLFGKGLETGWELFSGEPENEIYQTFIGNTIGGVADALQDLESPEKAKGYIYPMKDIFDKAILVFEKLLDADPENPESLGKFLNVIENIDSCFEAGELIESVIPLFDKRIAVFEKLLKSETENSQLLGRLDNSVMLFGDACENEGYFEEARHAYERAAEMYRKILEKEPENSDAAYHLSYTFSYLANLYQVQEKPIKAEEYYKEATDLLEKGFEADPANTSFGLPLANIYMELGILYSDEYEKAENFYLRARDVIRKLLDKSTDVSENYVNFVSSFDELATHFTEIDDSENAESCYQEELQLYDKMYQGDSKNPEYGLKVSEVYRKLGDLFADESGLERARAYYEKEIGAYENLSSGDFNKLALEAYIADTWNQLGKLYSDAEPETALQFYERALEVFEIAFEEEVENLIYSEGLIEALSGLGRVFKVQNEYGKAVRQYEKALEVKKQLLDILPQEACLDLDLEDTYFELAVLHSEMGDEEKTAVYHRLALERYEQILADNSEDHDFIILTAGKAFFLALVLFEKLIPEEQDSGFARGYYELALRTLDKLYEIYPMNLKLLDILVSFAEQVGDIYRGADMLDKSILEYEYVREHLEILYENFPENPIYLRHLLGVMNNLGIGYSVMDRLDKGKECFEKALELNESLSQSTPESLENLEFLKRTFMLFSNYAKLLEDLGDSESSKEYRKKAEEIDVELAEEDPEWESPL